MSKHTFIKSVAMGIASLALAACGQGFEAKNLTSLASELNNGATCSDARSKIFDAYHQAYSDDANLAAVSLKSALQNDLKGNADFAKSSPEAQAKYQKSIQTIHDLLTAELRGAGAAIQKSKPAPVADADGILEESEDSVDLHLSRLEMRSQIEPQYDVINAKLDAAIAEAAQAGGEVGISCANPPAADTQPSFGSTPETTGTTTVETQSVNSPIYGALYTMATSYQSCEVLSLRPVTTSVEAARGVVKGRSIDGIGYGREYTDVALLKRTHYYHRGQTYGPSCADQSRKPMVYDYGGVPVTSGTTVDMFKNAGGGSALGIDCSAFISTSAAVAGNLYKPSTSKNPVYRRFVSRDFINPTKSGWGCYKSVTTTAQATIQPGDIAAVRGHVVMVDKIGADPFGLTKVKSAAGCSSLSVKNFDFTLIQSSPEKGSLGINRYLAKDYLTGGGKMSTMFMAYAKATCQARFDGRSRNPVTADYGIIRHENTNSCLAKKVALTNESCISRCSSLRDFSAQ